MTDRQPLFVPCTTSGQETDRVHSYNPGTCMGRFPWELGIGTRGRKTRIMALPGREKVWQYLQTSGYNTPTWRDRQTPGDSKDRTYAYCIASHGKNDKLCVKWYKCALTLQKGRDNIPFHYYPAKLGSFRSNGIHSMVKNYSNGGYSWSEGAQNQTY